MMVGYLFTLLFFTSAFLLLPCLIHTGMLKFISILSVMGFL